jgi:formamidopyrimidine-DNA glycosylase
VVDDLRASKLAGRRILAARIYWPRLVRPSARAFREKIAGRLVQGITRRGKFIVMTLSGEWTLLVHLRMTGGLAFSDGSRRREKHEHLTLDLDDGRQLRYRDTRKFGRWLLVRRPDEILGALGPEPLDDGFRSGHFRRRLASHRRMLKPLLLDQGFIAGLGNIYVDEALWDAGLHPSRTSDSLSGAEQQALYRSIRKVLRRGIAAMGTSLGKASTNFYSVGGRRGRNQDSLRVFRRTGRPCPRCAEPIQRIIVAQRSTHVCPACQPPRA